ncbi:MAG: hypothetical protein NTW86_30615 [Candidatus Sumerlaeota bacterium]|nr:hypothetical protein [Candidatus Sumerlaeota bacterium]
MDYVGGAALTLSPLLFGALAAAETLLLHAGPQVVSVLPADLQVSCFGRTLSMARVKANMAGWREIGEAARQMRDAMNASAPAVIMAPGEHLTAHLAFYSGRPKECFALEAREAHNYRLWFEESGGLKGVNAVVLVVNTDDEMESSALAHSYAHYLKRLKTLFDAVEPAPPLVCYTDSRVELGNAIQPEHPALREFFIFRCYGFGGRMAAEPKPK